MSFYFREKPRFGDKLRGKSGDELIQELKQQFDDTNKSFFEPTSNRIPRDPFERHTGFSRGFPFDDVEGFGRRSSDIRSHLDDLASRHPEFADHLLGSAWGDIPAFHNTGSLRNRRRRGSGSSSTYQGHPDEDARSQTSGSSGTSAASGASGVSSRGEPPSVASNVYYDEKQRDGGTRRRNENDTENDSQSATRRNPIPQYGLRNTVDIGQQRHEMENDERASETRGQRSMSAPPENRQQNEPGWRAKPGEQTQNSNPRFVSRVDITPQFGQPPAASLNNEKTGAKPQYASANQQQKPPQQQSNVRHIPIFVEGRDEPVIPKNLDKDQTDSAGWSYERPQRTESPTHFQHNSQFGTPPQFHRPSHFNQHYPSRARDWLPNFEEEFYGVPQATSFHHPGVKRHQQPFTSQSPPRHYRQSETKPVHRSQDPSHFNNEQCPTSVPSQQQQRPQPQQKQQKQEAEAASSQPRKQTQPKDPLEKVADVQQEVDSLHQQVLQWNGKSRKERSYMYLDEMLTRELIKLDDIETEGKENVRQARKNTIKSIQDSISLLESKAPLVEQPVTEGTMDLQQETSDTADKEEIINSTMANDEATAENVKTEENRGDEQSAPLYSSSTEEPVAASPAVDESMPNDETTSPPENDTTSQQPSSTDNHEMDVIAPVTKVSSATSMETRTNVETDSSSTQQEAMPAAKTEMAMDVVESTESPKTLKKSRKTKKQEREQRQAPISDGAIPLPGPEPHETKVTE